MLKKTPPFDGALRQAWRKAKLVEGSGTINGAISGEDEELIVALAEGHHRTRRGIYDLFYRALKACGIDGRNHD